MSETRFSFSFDGSSAPGGGGSTSGPKEVSIEDAISSILGDIRREKEKPTVAPGASREEINKAILEMRAARDERESLADAVKDLTGVTSLSGAVEDLLKNRLNPVLPTDGTPLSELAELLQDYDRAVDSEGSLGDQADLLKTNQALLDAITSLAEAVKEMKPAGSGEFEPKKMTISEFVINKILRPGAQAAFTPTLFRNNLERSATQLAGVFLKSRGAAQTVAPGLQQGVSAAAASVLPKNLTALAGTIGSVTATSVTLAATFATVTAGAALMAGSIVALSAAIGALTDKMADYIRQFSPEVQFQDALNLQQDLFNRQRSALLIGDDTASLMEVNREFDTALAEFSTQLFDLASPALEFIVTSGTTVLEVLNGILGWLNANPIPDTIEQEQVLEFRKQVAKIAFANNLSTQILQLGSQVDAEAKDLLEGLIERELPKPPPTPPWWYVPPSTFT